MVFWLLGRRQRDPLPPVLEPEAPGRAVGRYVRRILDESRAYLNEGLDSFGVLEDNRSGGYSIRVRPVQGTKMTMARLEADVPMEPDKLFKLLRTMDGKRIIDPFPREKHSQPVKALRARGADAEIVYSEAPRFHGVLRPREYVTCDAEAPRERFFVCKSVKLDKGPLVAPSPGHVRANLLFSMRLLPVRGKPGVTHLQMINWLDLGGNTVPPLVANLVTERWYFQGVMRRLNRHIQEHGLAEAEPGAAAGGK